MNTSIRAVGFAALLAMAGAGAQADVVTKTIDFADLGSQPEASGSGVVIGDHYRAKFGVVFDAGGRVYNLNPPPPLGGSQGYYSNVGDSIFGIDVDAGTDYDLLTIDFAVGTSPFLMKVTDRGGKDTGWLRLVGSPNWSWSENVVIDLSAIEYISRIDFQVSSAGTYFAIDNLDLGRTFTGGTVPEPAGLGLVALALAAAALATRRRGA